MASAGNKSKASGISTRRRGAIERRPGREFVALSQEWETVKQSKIVFFKRLAAFFRAEYPEIRLAAEAEKDLAIRDLANSGSFAQTHGVIARLAQYADFTPAQLNEIVSAALSNGQVYWIAGDDDVHTFLSGVIRGRENQIEPGNLEKLQALLRAHGPASDNAPS